MTSLENPTRRAIIMALRERELCAGTISETLGRRRPAISHHLARLQTCGLVECRSQGAFRYYRLNVKRTLAAWTVYLRPGVGAPTWARA
jgi:DNA-binding transcriptional ArsR family regulator